MKRVMIVGSGGAGKSTFAKRLHEITKIPLFHLDKLHWKPGWIEPPEDEWLQTIKSVIDQDEWILDGNYGGTVDERMTKCDTVIFIDLPRMVCIYRVLKRRLKYHGTNRPDMTEGCNEKIDAEFLGWIWNYPKTKRPPMEERFKQFEDEKNIIRLRSRKEVENFLAKLESDRLKSI